MTVGPFGGRFAGDPFVPAGQQIAAGPPDVATARPAILYVQTADDGAGHLVARFGPPPAGRVWLVRRITVQADKAVRAYVYVGEPVPSSLVAGTRSGQMDENEARQPYYVPESTPLVVRWDAGPTAASARIEYLEHL